MAGDATPGDGLVHTKAVPVCFAAVGIPAAHRGRASAGIGIKWVHTWDAEIGAVAAVVADGSDLADTDAVPSNRATVGIRLADPLDAFVRATTWHQHAALLARGVRATERD